MVLFGVLSLLAFRQCRFQLRHHQSIALQLVASSESSPPATDRGILIWLQIKKKIESNSK